MDLNKVMIIGRSVTTPDVKRIESSGTAVLNFTVATNRKFKNKDGNIQEEAEYHRCVAYGNSAEVLGKYMDKGKRMFIEWRLKTRKRADANAVERFSTEIIIDHFIFLDPKGPHTNWDDHHDIDTQSTDTNTNEDVSDTEDLPF